MSEIFFIYVLNSLLYASILFLISAGISLVYGVMRILNLAHGTLYALGAYVSAWLLTLLAAGSPAAALYILPAVGALAVGFAGIVMEPSVLRPMYTRAEEYQLLMTFGALLILEDVIRLLWGPYPLLAKEPYTYLGGSTILGYLYPNYNMLVIAVGLTVALALWAFVYRTKFGVILRATSLDRDMASALGVNVKRLYTISFALGTTLAGLAGAFIVPTQTAVLGMGIDALVLAFVVMVIGGLGSLKGAFVGSILVGVARSTTIALPSPAPEMELAILYLIAAAILLVRPTGLFGRA